MQLLSVYKECIFSRIAIDTDLLRVPSLLQYCRLVQALMILA